MQFYWNLKRNNSEKAFWEGTGLFSEGSKTIKKFKTKSLSGGRVSDQNGIKMHKTKSEHIKRGKKIENDPWTHLFQKVLSFYSSFIYIIVEIEYKMMVWCP